MSLIVRISKKQMFRPVDGMDPETEVESLLLLLPSSYGIATRNCTYRTPIELNRSKTKNIYHHEIRPASPGYTARFAG